MDGFKIENMIGMTFSSIDGLTNGSYEVRFTATDGRQVVMNHLQDCCEHVSVEDVCGDVTDLMGSPIVRAEAPSSLDGKQAGVDDTGDGDQEWTFYILGTAKGTVTIRWLGESNGYYSTKVDLYMADSVN